MIDYLLEKCKFSSFIYSHAVRYDNNVQITIINDNRLVENFKLCCVERSTRIESYFRPTRENILVFSNTDERRRRSVNTQKYKSRTQAFAKDNISRRTTASSVDPKGVLRKCLINHYDTRTVCVCVYITRVLYKCLEQK